MLSIELEGLRCRVHGEERTRHWSDMNIRLRNGRHPTRLLQILGDIGKGNRLTQRRGDVNDRKAISDKTPKKVQRIPLFVPPPVVEMGKF